VIHEDKTSKLQKKLAKETEETSGGTKKKTKTLAEKNREKKRRALTILYPSPQPRGRSFLRIYKKEKKGEGREYMINTYWSTLGGVSSSINTI